MNHRNLIILSTVLFYFLTIAILSIDVLITQKNLLKESLDWNSNLRNKYEDFAYEKFNCIEPRNNERQMCLFRNVNDLINNQQVK